MKTLLALLLSVVVGNAAQTNTFKSNVEVGSGYTLSATIQSGLCITNFENSSGLIIRPHDSYGWNFFTYDEFGTNALMKVTGGGVDTTEIYSGLKVQGITNSGTYNSIKVYTATLTQSGVAAPVATVLENTTGATITWTRNAVGDYLGTASSSVFTASKTAIHVSGANFGDPFSTINSGRVGASQVRITTTDEFGFVDELLSTSTPGSVSIRIYP